MCIVHKNEKKILYPKTALTHIKWKIIMISITFYYLWRSHNFFENVQFYVFCHEKYVDANKIKKSRKKLLNLLK